MRIEEPAPGEPRRPDVPRDPGDAWVIADDGTRYWGRFGAAGLLAWDPERGEGGSVLLQHRVAWSHFGGTWGIPGGARHEGEDATTAALREAREEAGVPQAGLCPLYESVLDLGIWTYTTLVVRVDEPFEPVIADPESVALEWVPVGEVAELPLHPGFADAWGALRTRLVAAPVLVVDAANVVGSVPDGWWRDRAGAAGRLRDRLEALVARGVAVHEPVGGAAEAREFPEVTLVVEGAARGMPEVESAVRVVRAEGSGDDAIVREVDRLVAQGRRVVVVTSDRGLASRVEALGARVHGARVHGARWLLDQLS